MRILLSNDDGIFSPGLRALADVAAQFGEVVIFAPDYEQSAIGHAITIMRPLQVHPVKLITGYEAYRVNGTPADCVALGLDHLGGADLVLSGINIGLNLGNDIWHSGTVAAAKQAVLLGVRAIAFSQALNGGEPSYEKQKPYVAEVLRMLTQENPPKLVNVNLPNDPRGIRWTHQSVRAYNGKVVAGEDPMGRKHFWLAAVPLTEPEVDSDRWAAEQDLVSLTPLRLDLTDEKWLENIGERQSELGSPVPV